MDLKNARKEFKEGFLWMWESVLKWVSNIIAGKDWWENNIDTKKLMFEWEIVRNGPSNANVVKTPAQTPDISKPQDKVSQTLKEQIPWASWIDSLDLVEAAHISDRENVRNILNNSSVQAEDEILKREENRKQEGFRNTAGQIWKDVWMFVWRTINPMFWAYKLSRWWQRDSTYQSNEKNVLVWYNPDNGNVMQLAINKWQGLTDDFRATVSRKTKWNEQSFEYLHNQYNKGLESIWASNLDDATKWKLANELFQAFKKEVEDRELLKVYENDYYSDWLFWSAFDKDSTWLWRMKNKLTDEQKNNLSKSKIKEWWIYKLSDKQFEDFLDAYSYNKDLRQWIWETEGSEFAKSIWRWINDDDENKILVEIDEWNRAEAMSAQQELAMKWAVEYLNSLKEAWKINWIQENAITNRVSSVVNERLWKMWLYLWAPLWYYKLVQNKTTPLTDWERSILWFWPEIINLMEDYTDALWQWAEETVRTWIDEDGELSSIPETINWLTINDFFKDAIARSNEAAWWVELLWTESALDAMQLLWQNINYLFWQDKWKWPRRARTDISYYAWQYWFTAVELWQIWLWWYWRLIWWDKFWDYGMADFSTAYLAETDDPTVLRSSDLWWFLKEYWLKGYEIAWETIWWVVWESPFLWRAVAPKKLTQVAKAVDTAGKTNRKVQSWNWLYQSAKQSLWNTSAVQQWKKIFNTISDAISPNASMKMKAMLELWKSWMKRVARDQIIDTTLTYLDTESYSTPSFYLSMWFTGVTELLPALLKDTQILKMVGNKLRWLSATENTWWKMIDYMTSSPEVMKRFETFFWTSSPTFKQLKIIGNNWWWWEFEDILKQMYNQLNPEVKLAMDNFSKDVMMQQISNLMKIDWDSSYWKNLRSLINANWTNAADLWKYIFKIPGEVEVWWFTSSILFKQWADTQTRYLTKSYDVALDNIDWWFRQKLQKWFTKWDIQQIASNTKYKSVMDWNEVNWKLFELWEDWKYILNGEWAKELWLDVSEYTEAMARADILRKEAEWTKQMIDDNISKLAQSNWISPDTIKDVVESWAFRRMIDEFQRVLC